MTKKELIDRLRKEKNWDIKYMTFCFWEAKGYVGSSKKVTYIGRTVPVYSDEDYKNIVNNLERLNGEGKVRLKILNL